MKIMKNGKIEAEREIHSITVEMKNKKKRGKKEKKRKG